VLLCHPCVTWFSDTSFPWCASGYNYKVNIWYSIEHSYMLCGYSVTLMSYWCYGLYLYAPVDHMLISCLLAALIITVTWYLV
jgi:hypothetical protein